MPRLKILATDHSFSAEIVAEQAWSVFPIVNKLECKEADVLVDGAYAYSLRIQQNGLWSIFQRDHALGWDDVTENG